MTTLRNVRLTDAGDGERTASVLVGLGFSPADIRDKSRALAMGCTPLIASDVSVEVAARVAAAIRDAGGEVRVSPPLPTDFAPIPPSYLAWGRPEYVSYTPWADVCAARKAQEAQDRWMRRTQTCAYPHPRWDD
jgi:hypothetical protein